MRDNSLSTRFLDAYNELDDYMRTLLDKEDHFGHTGMLNHLEDNNIFKPYIREFKQYAKLRNAIVHDWNTEYHPIAEPHERIVKRYERLVVEVKKPKKCLYIATRKHEMDYAECHDRVLDVMHIMREKGYSYMPIIKHTVVVGVFSENSLFTYFLNKNKLSLDCDCTIEDLDGCIALGNHMSERFEFVPRDMPAMDVVDMFSRDIAGGKRLAAVFVTQNGKQDERMLGMISSWDVIDFVDEMILK